MLSDFLDPTVFQIYIRVMNPYNGPKGWKSFEEQQHTRMLITNIL